MQFTNVIKNGRHWQVMDTNVGTHNVVYTDIESADNYDNIYQSDLCGWVPWQPRTDSW